MDKQVMVRVFFRTVKIATALIAVIGTVLWFQAQGGRTAKVRDMQQAATSGVNTGGMKLGGDFEMLDHTGAAVTQADYAGKYLLIYFGYSYCPDVCPSELQRMIAALDLAGDAAEQIQPIFVTVDPERDTPAQLAEYVPMFHPRLVGLTGSAEQVARMADAWKVYYARSKAEDSTNYLMDHSSYIYLMAPDGAPLKMFRAQSKPADMAKAIEDIVDSSAG